MKKLVSLLLVLVLCLSTATCLAAPAGRGPQAPGHQGPGRNTTGPGAAPVDTRNRQKAEEIVIRANCQIAAKVAWAQATPEDDVEWLIAVTNSISAKARAEVAALGFTAVCSYVVYFVDGRYVPIDPLNVVNDPTKPRPPISSAQLGDSK